jgi:serine/threonine-protein kinase
MICPSCTAENDDVSEYCHRCGVALNALKPGTVLANRYQISGLVGRGGMGVVYRAHDRALDETVALKVLRPDVARTRELQLRFVSEIKLARKVRHRHVCGIHEYQEDGRFHFIVMELVDGVDLRSILREHGAMPPEKACDLAVQIASGLQAIHDAGIVHRDLKTPNIMLDRTGNVRLMDFGIAKQTEAATDLTATGHIVGTPEYMSPEQAMGQKIDARSDVYALGVVVFELFTGQVPFRGETPVATIMKHIQEPPPFMDATGHPRLPFPVASILTRALAKAPEERYASAQEMSQDLLRARVSMFPVTPAPTPPTGIRPGTNLEETRALRTPTPQPAARQGVTPRTPLPQARRPTPRPGPQRPGSGRYPAPAASPPATAGPSRPLPPPRPRGMHPLAWVAAGALAIAGIAVLAFVLNRLLTQLRSETVTEGPLASLPGPTMEKTPTDPGSGVVPPSLQPSPTAAETPAPAATPQPSPTRRARLAPTPTPSATPPPTPEPTASPSRSRRPGRDVPVPVTLSPQPSSTPRPPRNAAAIGHLKLRILPWAAVSVDGKSRGTTPLRPLDLPPGEHRVQLNHPDYKPLHKTVTIVAGETTTLEVDLAFEAFPK